jgi:hypothetical protein
VWQCRCVDIARIHHITCAHPREKYCTVRESESCAWKKFVEIHSSYNEGWRVGVHVELEKEMITSSSKQIPYVRNFRCDEVTADHFTSDELDKNRIKSSNLKGDLDAWKAGCSSGQMAVANFRRNVGGMYYMTVANFPPGSPGVMYPSRDVANYGRATWCDRPSKLYVKESASFLAGLRYGVLIRIDSAISAEGTLESAKTELCKVRYVKEYCPQVTLSTLGDKTNFGLDASTYDETSFREGCKYGYEFANPHSDLHDSYNTIRPTCIESKERQAACVTLVKEQHYFKGKTLTDCGKYPSTAVFEKKKTEEEQAAIMKKIEKEDHEKALKAKAESEKSWWESLWPF